MCAVKASKNTSTQYADKVRVYINEESKTAVPVWSTYKDRSSWRVVHVGDYKANARPNDVGAVENELLQKFYPGHNKHQSFFTDTSYHSPLNQKTAGKIHTYGTDKTHQIEYSLYEPVEAYKLLSSVKGQDPYGFGKELTSLKSYNWHNVVNNWGVGRDGKGWQVAYNIHYPDGSKETVFESDVLSDPDAALPIFQKAVDKARANTRPDAIGKTARSPRSVVHFNVGFSKTGRHTGKPRVDTVGKLGSIK